MQKHCGYRTEKSLLSTYHIVDAVQGAFTCVFVSGGGGRMGRREGVREREEWSILAEVSALLIPRIHTYPANL